MLESTLNPATALRAIAARAPDRPAIVYPDQAFSYRALMSLTEAFALRLRGLGVGPEATVHLNSRDTAVVVPVVLATALLGARFLQNVGTLDQTGLPHVTHALRGPDAAEDSGHAVAIDASWSPATVRAEGLAWSPEDDARCPDAPWLIVYTSGTTGLPKFVALTQRMMAGRSAAVADEFRPDEARIAALFPSDSRPFLARMLATFWNGATLVDSRDPEVWARAGVTRVTGSLAQAKALCTDRVLVPRIPEIEVSGARLSDADAALLLRSFERVDDTYGATETNKTFSHFKTLSSSGEVVSTPHPRDSIIQILRADGTPAGPDEEGELRIRNAYMATGYLDAPEATARAFRDSWFHPGDRGLWGEDGALVIRPRAGEFVNAEGSKIGLPGIDRVLASVDGIREAVVFPSPKPEAEGRLIAFAVFDGDVNRPQVVERARQRCTEVLGARLTPAVIRPIADLPRLPDGSPDRETCKSLILEAAARAAESAD
ncbi:class I adenylate-forming enzyme family protein [Tabrizicola soli]|uniref:Class I adenylate-forming enzyme family protein n=1 Tax=Tabrizicola soli TaxID=2185115 RepID=A0ABV7E0R4_9RHOB|nr:class I adenylate-forming enzyme family protein [Tabrizicola soli]